MSITGAYMVPHPPVIMAEVGRGEEKKIQKTIDAFTEVGRRIGKITKIGRASCRERV